MHILSRLARYRRGKGRDRQRAAAYRGFHVSKQFKIPGCFTRKGFDIQMDAIRTGLDETARMIGERPFAAPHPSGERRCQEFRRSMG